MALLSSSNPVRPHDCGFSIEASLETVTTSNLRPSGDVRKHAVEPPVGRLREPPPVTWPTVEREPRRARARGLVMPNAGIYGIGTPASGPFACENSQTPLTLLAVPSNTR